MILILLMGILGVALGALITWQMTKRYYERASKELKKEATALRGLTGMILRALQNAGLATLRRDEQGKTVGLIINLKVDR